MIPYYYILLARYKANEADARQQALMKELADAHKQIETLKRAYDKALGIAVGLQKEVDLLRGGKI